MFSILNDQNMTTFSKNMASYYSKKKCSCGSIYPRLDPRCSIWFWIEIV